jgi:hypothetical protein
VHLYLFTHFHLWPERVREQEEGKRRGEGRTRASEGGDGDALREPLPIQILALINYDPND